MDMKSNENGMASKETALSGETGKEVTNNQKELSVWDKKPTCYIPIRGEKAGCNYIVVKVKGDCMNSDLSPIRIKDGDYLVMYEIPATLLGMFNNSCYAQSKKA
jgi:hypothetical protein